ncbi:MAG: response regulator transcription factor [Flavobacteriales bacterium]|nr:MAG: response regulator transcription factor [Flavobacteriales bacterium]
MKILVVDDHEIFRYGVKLVLESMCPNATVLEAENLDCAVNMIAAQDMRLIIFNANLTGADRLEALIRFIIKDSKVVIFPAMIRNRNFREVYYLQVQVLLFSKILHFWKSRNYSVNFYNSRCAILLLYFFYQSFYNSWIMQMFQLLTFKFDHLQIIPFINFVSGLINVLSFVVVFIYIMNGYPAFNFTGSHNSMVYMITIHAFASKFR